MSWRQEYHKMANRVQLWNFFGLRFYLNDQYREIVYSSYINGFFFFFFGVHLKANEYQYTNE